MSQITCPRRASLFGGRPCQFEPRYDYDGPSDALKEHCETQVHLSNADKEKLIERRTYVKDVCIKCGTPAYR